MQWSALWLTVWKVILIFPYSRVSSVAKPSVSQAKYLDYEIGASIHFNMQTFNGTMKSGHVVSPDAFNPTKLSTDQWLRAAKSFGAKYAVLTLDHFSGFLLWPTTTNYSYSVKSSNWRNKTGDVALDFIQSCAKYGIKHAFYYSVNKNWYMNVSNHRAPSPGAQTVYNRIVEQQIRELLNPSSKYASPFLFWFDAGIVSGISPNVVPIFHSLAENIICLKCPASSGIAGARWIGNERAVASLPLWYAVRDGGYNGDPLGEQFRPPFCDTVIREHKWFWLPRTRNRVKNVSTLITEYLTSVGRGCHMILNLNPDPFGLIEDEDLHAYKGFGEAIGLLYKDLIITQKNATLKIGVEKVWRIPRILNVANGSVVVMEDVAKFGQLVREYQLRFNTSHGWVNYPEYGSTIGHKRIHPFPQVLRGKPVYAISFKIVKLVTRDPSITIREVSVYDWTEATRKRYI
ncbi:unnamed protein product [Porites evermanni]|uniref:alpha-L-fucosidase n=1 Tax=Porites evermanni TaxID=104178 RepID=A0ABN8LPX8_9CNID|nr:unnamed protein product [Porites evermanni]